MDRKSWLGVWAVIGIAFAMMFGAGPAVGTTTVFFGSSYTGTGFTLPSRTSALASFLSAGGGAGLFTTYNFDGIGSGTTITGMSFGSCPSALTVNSVGGSAPLVVVAGSSTSTPSTGWFGSTLVSAATNQLLPTSGSNVISPGGTALSPGPSASVENDDLQVTFSCGGGSGPGAYAVGLDILFQSLDAASFLSITVFQGSSSTTLFVNGFIPTGIPGCGPASFTGVTDPACGGAPGGHVFFGICSTTPTIGKVVIDDYDGNNIFPDSNVGYDTIVVRGPGGPGPSC